MKTTLELPDHLMRAVKVRAAESNRRLKDVIAELIERGLEDAGAAEAPEDPLQAWAKKLVFHADGTVTNPDGIEDSEFFESLENLREEDRRSPPRDPFAGFEE